MNPIKTISPLLLTLLTTLSFAQSKETYQKIGDSLFAAKQYDQLIKYFDKELKKYPKNEDVLRWLGYVHIAANKPDAAEKYYLQALAVNPACANCYFNLGRIYSFKDDDKKSLEYIEKAIETDPANALFYSARARVKEMLGDKKGSLRDHDKAIELDRDNFEYHMQRGIYHGNAGSDFLALADLDKAIQLAPKNYEPYFHRANVYYGMKRYEKALADVNKAIELDSTQFSVYTGRGAIFDVMNEYEKAIQDYTKAIALNKNDFLPYLNRAASYYSLEKIDASCADYSTLKSFIDKGELKDQSLIAEVKARIQDICDSSKASYYYQRGIGHYNLKEYLQAVAMYVRGLKKFPSNAMMLSFAGNAYLALGEYEQALEYYNRSLKFKESILEELKLNSKFAGAPEKAKTDFYNGSLASIYFTMSQCKVNLNRVDEALADINKAIETGGNIPDINREEYFTLRGHIYLTKGRFDDALSEFNKSIQHNKSYALAYVNRAIAKVSMADKVTFRSYTVNSNLNRQPMSVNWTVPDKSSLAASKVNLMSALQDCNTAIDLDKQFGFAYYIRGQVKQLLEHEDYCYDLLMAKKLGLVVEEELIKNCSGK